MPFGHLVPDERMLPAETLRLFYLDMSWVDALVSGALSVGAQSSRDTQQDQIIGDTVRDTAARQAEAYRDTVREAPCHPREYASASCRSAILRSSAVRGFR